MCQDEKGLCVHNDGVLVLDIDWEKEWWKSAFQ